MSAVSADSPKSLTLQQIFFLLLIITCQIGLLLDEKVRVPFQQQHQPTSIFQNNLIQRSYKFQSCIISNITCFHHLSFSLIMT